MTGRMLKGLCMGAMAVGVLGTTLPLAAQGRENMASMESFQISSHGSPLNAFVYIAAGAGPHPVVVLLHGFPGNERNLDLAQDIRRAGWDVLYFNYRGSWGTPGTFLSAMELRMWHPLSPTCANPRTRNGCGWTRSASC